MCGDEPDPRMNHTLVYDSRRGASVLFGGSNRKPGGCEGWGEDTCPGLWEWDGEVWARRCNGSPPGDDCGAQPTPRTRHVAAYDAARGVMVVFSGESAEDFGREECPDGTHPSGLRCYLDDLWEWDGSAWREVEPEDPEGDGDPWQRAAAAMAWDPVREVTVLVGGLYDAGVGGSICPDGSESDELGWCLDRRIWEWDGRSWRSHEPAGAGPTWRRSHTLDYDVAHRGLEMLGGTLGYADEPWEWLWDGEAWSVPLRSDPELDGNPGTRWSHASAYDEAGDRLLLLGGEGFDASLWEARGGEEMAAGHVFHAAFGAARAEPGSTLEELSVSWRGAALGGRGGACAAVPGARLDVWTHGRWQTRAEHRPGAFELDAEGRPPWDGEAGGDALWDLSWSTEDPKALSDLRFGPRQLISFALRPVALNGRCPVASEVISDNVELEVRYRRPER